MAGPDGDLCAVVLTEQAHFAFAIKSDGVTTESFKNLRITPESQR